MDADEFVDYCKSHINLEESGLRQPSAQDIRRWTDLNILHTPPYLKNDIHIVIGVLRLESEAVGPRAIPGHISPRPQYGPRVRKEKRLKKQERKDWKRQVNAQISSADFQEMVSLARKSLMLPESGLPAEQVDAFLFSSFLAAWCNYCWSLEPFQRRFLALEGKEARTEYLRPMLGKFSELIAEYTMPEQSRPQAVDWLLCTKLIAARLSSILGIDNTSDMFLYILSPELRSPESWHLRRINPGQNPFRRQFERFTEALMLFSEEEPSNGTARKYIDTTAQLTFDLLEGKITWEESRTVYARTFPFYSVELPDAHRMRAKRATHKLPYSEILKAAGSFLSQ